MARATTLPILPTLMMRLLGVSENMGSEVRDYQRAISRDGAMAPKIPRTAKSPYCRWTREITSLQLALID